MTARGRRGHSKLSDSIDDELRLGMYRHLIVNDLVLGRFFEMVAAGQVFSSMIKAVTIAATHNTPIAANTATPVLGLLNTSPVMAGVLLKAGLGTVSGTPAGGAAVLNYQPAIGTAGIISAAATGSIFNADGRPGASPQGSIMKPLNNVALTGWTASPGAVQETLPIAQASAAAVAGNGGVDGPFLQDVDALQLVPPGGFLALMAGTGAGTSWIVNAGWVWVEIPWPFGQN